MMRVWPVSPLGRSGTEAAVPLAPASGRRVAVALTALLLLCPFQAPAAQGLELTLVPPTLVGEPGSAVTFNGRITNTTGAPLDAIDLFLNFSGYDPLIFTDITQLLGSPNFTLPNNTFSAIVPLFRLMLGAGAPVGDYEVAVSLESLDNVVSNTATAHVLVQEAITTVPEPSTAAFLAGGLLLLAVVRMPRRWRPRGGQRLP